MESGQDKLPIRIREQKVFSGETDHRIGVF